MALPAWLPVTVSLVSVVIALCAFIWQIHRARFNQSVDLLFRLENDFFGPAKRLQRAKAARDLLQGHVLEAEPILDFFETMALLLRRGALDPEMVEHTFFYWIDRYFEATKVFVAERRKTDPLLWKDLTHLVASIRATRAKQPSPYQPPSAPQIADFLVEEQTEA